MRLVMMALLFAVTQHAAVRIQIVKGRPVAAGVVVNGHGPYRFLIDTATTSNHIEAGLAESIGLSANYRTELVSSVGRAIVKGCDGVRVELGEARAAEQHFLFTGSDILKRLDAGIEGILGQEFLARFDYLLDLRSKTLELLTPQPPEGARTPFRVLNGRAAINTSLGELVLDSGTTDLILFGVAPEQDTTAYLHTVAGARLVSMVYRNLMIGGRRFFSGSAVALPDRNEPGIAGLMPIALFRAIYVSNSQSFAIFR